MIWITVTEVRLGYLKKVIIIRIIGCIQDYKEIVERKLESVKGNLKGEFLREWRRMRDSWSIYNIEKYQGYYRPVILR